MNTKKPYSSFDGRVLVVEDEQVNRFVARGLMTPLGIEPDFAESGLEAVAKVAARDYDLVLMDVQMPDMDGIEATTLIRDHERAAGRKRVPIVALTAFAAVTDRRRCIDAGMDDHMTKPLMIDNLVNTLQRWLGGKDDVAEQAEVQEVAHEPQDGALNTTLDATRFATLVQSMQSVPGGLGSVLESYLESLDRLPDVMEKAVQEGDVEALARAAHSLKSNSAAAGALELAKHSEQLEELARQGDGKKFEALVLSIKNEISHVKLAVERELDVLAR